MFDVCFIDVDFVLLVLMVGDFEDLIVIFMLVQDLVLLVIEIFYDMCYC